MIGIAKRLTAQTLSQIFFFALCAPPTGSIPPQQSQRRTVLGEIRDCSDNHRRWGDTKDIGFREIAAVHEKDIKAGQDAIKEMKMRGPMPHDLDNRDVQSYVETVAQRVAQHSDLTLARRNRAGRLHSVTNRPVSLARPVLRPVVSPQSGPPAFCRQNCV